MMSDPIKNGVVSKAPAHAIRETARKDGFRMLREDDPAKVLAGVTTVEAVPRVTQLEWEYFGWVQ